MAHGAVVLRSSFRDRLIGALRLNPNTYTEVASDDTATGQGAVIITIGGILGVIQLWLNGTWSQVGAALPPIVVVFLAVLGIIFWWLVTILYVGLLAVIATMRIRGPQTRMAFWRLLRAFRFGGALGAVFGLLRLLPSIGGVIGVAIMLWTFVAQIIGIRKAVGVTIGRAVAIIIGAGIIIIGLLVTLDLAVIGVV